VIRRTVGLDFPRSLDDILPAQLMARRNPAAGYPQKIESKLAGDVPFYMDDQRMPSSLDMHWARCFLILLYGLTDCPVCRRAIYLKWFEPACGIRAYNANQ
jgi:hypothetical protein